MNRNGIYIFVNRRTGARPPDLHAIHEAYRNILPPAVFPPRCFSWRCLTTKSTSTCIPQKLKCASAFAICSRFCARCDSPGADGRAADCQFRGRHCRRRCAARWSGEWNASGGITPAPVESGVPRAMIPPMEEIGVGSGVGSDFVPGGGFDPPARRCGRSNSGFHSLRGRHLAPPLFRRKFRRREIGLPI